jgi:hypothetical protein
MGSRVYLCKDNDDLISHCTCREALVAPPGQADCPWCGCGWLFSCLSCRKAFTFARAVPGQKDLEMIVREHLCRLVHTWDIVLPEAEVAVSLPHEPEQRPRPPSTPADPHLGVDAGAVRPTTWQPGELGGLSHVRCLLPGVARTSAP